MNSVSMGRSIPQKLFSMQHLFFDYLPKRIGVFVIPVGLIVALAVESRQKQLFFGLFAVLMTLVQISNYLVCWHKHNELEARYGDDYRKQLAAELERTGMNRLVDQFWIDMKRK